MGQKEEARQARLQLPSALHEHTARVSCLEYLAGPGAPTGLESFHVL